MQPFFKPATWTQVPNEVFDELMKILPPNEFKILMVIIRKTIGFQKQSDRIPFSQFMEMTGIKNRTNFSKNLQSLKERGLIVCSTETVPCEYGLAVDWYRNSTGTGTETVPKSAETGTETVLSKENNIKKQYKENLAAPPRKCTDEEIDVRNKIYDAFIAEYGPIDKLQIKREMKAIMQIIARAKERENGGFAAFAFSMVAQFINIKHHPEIKAYTFLAQQPALPSALNSSGIWPRVLETLRERESKTPTEHDIKILDLACKAVGRK